MKSVLYPIVEEADTQDIVVRSLDAHTTYRINVSSDFNVSSGGGGVCTSKCGSHMHL